ncbi:MAG: oxidoreductase [Anaerolineae bacterium]|nr:oxidoreductase [Anaerolineae bacterium]
MKKKVILGGIGAILTGVGAYLWVSKQQQAQNETAGGAWTTANIPDQSSKVAIVTGANSGIGYETALELAQNGATVVMACRSLPKAEAAAAEIRQTNPPGEVVIMELDLGDLDSVRRFAVAFQKRYDRLDMLINNAGIMMIPYGKTEDGFEKQFGTNHLGHFALTGLLLDLLLNTPQARVVNISSSGHRTGTMDFSNLMFEGGQGYTPMASYARSKLANLHFTYELQRRLEAIGSSCIAVAAHPGASGTNLGNHLAEGAWHMRLLFTVGMSFAQSPAMGALPTLRAAVGADVRGGDYYGPNGLMEMRGYPVKVKSNNASHSKADAEQLWQVSEQLTGVRFEQLEAI